MISHSNLTKGSRAGMTLLLVAAFGLTALFGAMAFAQDDAAAPPTDPAPAAVDAAAPADATPAAPVVEPPAAADTSDAVAPPTVEPPAETPTPVEPPVVEPPAADEPPAETPSASAADDESSTPAGEVQATDEEKPEAAKLDWTKILTVLGMAAVLIVVPILIAQWIGSATRSPEHVVRIWAMLFALLAGCVLMYSTPMTKGIDLSGGVIMVYQVQMSGTADAEDGADEDADQKPTGDDDDDGHALSSGLMNAMTTALKQRIDPAGVREIDIRKFGADEIKIIIPEADDSELQRLRRVISSAGTLEFRILAERWDPDHADVIARAMATDEDKVRDDNDKQIATWVSVKPGNENEFPGAITRTVEGRGLQVLVLKDQYDVTGDRLASAKVGIDQKNAKPAVDFKFNARGSQLFGQLTTEFGPNEATGNHYKLGIVLSDYLTTAPNINEPIFGNGQITGGGKGFEKKEAQEIVDILNAGQLPAKLSREPVSEQLIGPTLGADRIKAGEYAILLSGVVVLVFMVLYYRFAGVIACGAVALNLIMIVGVMKMIHAAFTLPGLAGLVLTVGMAVDANVLIFERIREELDKNATLRMAIRNGFQKAFSTILDANLTTLITAVILWWVGSEQIKGFAVTLFLGVLFSMFTAIYVSRGIFEIAEKMRWITQLKMMRIVGHTSYDFMSKRAIAAVCSIVVIVVGLGAVYMRGADFLGIDFVGGVSIQAVFKEELTQDEIRSRLEEAGFREPDVNNVVLNQDEDHAHGEWQFIIESATPPGRDAEKYRQELQAFLMDEFHEQLKFHEVAYALGDVETSADGKTTCMVTLTFPQEDGVKFVTAEGLVNDYIERNAEMEELKDLATCDVMSKDDPAPHNEWLVRVKAPETTVRALFDGFVGETNEMPYFPSSGTIGGSVARDSQVRAIMALTLALACIIGYIWFRFNGVIFGVAAVVALVHDVLVTLGMLAISKWLAVGPLESVLGIESFKIGLAELAAFLTIIGYSLNDTIVVFDRIREVRGKSPHLSIDTINTSLNQTLSRTLLTSITTLMVVLILYFFGGDGIHTFAAAMVLGVLVGTYSSIFVASPILHWLFQITVEKKLQQS